MRRREFITLLGGTATWPLAAQAQDTGRVRRLGMLLSFRENDPEIQSRIQAFTTELEKLGWRVGRNLQIDYRWGANEVASAQTAAAELLGLGPDLILAQNTPAAAALQQATRSIPIVFVGVGDPVVQGFVASLARPGGNLTGFSHGEPTMAGKWVELLKELAPRVTRVTEILNPKTSPYAELSFRTVETAAQKFAIEAAMAHVRESADIEAVMTSRTGAGQRIDLSNGCLHDAPP
jgi:putative tryptophan/tyrosine transport system substrate-binding protein